MNKTEREGCERRKAEHIKQLEGFGLIQGNFHKLRLIECDAARVATFYSNGKDLHGKPYGSAELERDTARLITRLEKIFRLGVLPDGFFINTDPRGYALKISDKVNTLRQRDWGGYGLLAPDNDNY